MPKLSNLPRGSAVGLTQQPEQEVLSSDPGVVQAGGLRT
jgi:hypothetical protein